MREIEKSMVSAIKEMKNFRLSNTSVEKRFDGTMEVRLFGNVIARVDQHNVMITNCNGWRSVTTASRVNAILREFTEGFRVSRKGDDWQFIDRFGLKSPFVPCAIARA